MCVVTKWCWTRGYRDRHNLGDIDVQIRDGPLRRSLEFGFQSSSTYSKTSATLVTARLCIEKEGSRAELRSLLLAISSGLCLNDIKPNHRYPYQNFTTTFPMARKAIAKDQVVKLIVGAGQASPSPPVGPALGSKGVKSIDFCKVIPSALAPSQGSSLNSPSGIQRSNCLHDARYTNPCSSHRPP